MSRKMLDRRTSIHQEFILPPPSPTQSYVTVSAIPTGTVTRTKSSFNSNVRDGDDTFPSLAFLISHPGLSTPDPLGVFPSGKPFRMMFDLGVSSNPSNPALTAGPELVSPEPQSELSTLFSSAGLKISEIQAILLSHVHPSHHGTLSDFPDAKLLLSADTSHFLHPDPLDLEPEAAAAAANPKDKGKAKRKDSAHQQLHLQAPYSTDSRIFSLPDPREALWGPLGPFESALDLLGDGSLYVIDVPGHAVGHVALLCRLDLEKWVCLVGDAFWDGRVLEGIGWAGNAEGLGEGEGCVDGHADPETAARSMRKLAILASAEGVELVAAHDGGWMKGAEREGRLFPNVL